MVVGEGGRRIGRVESLLSEATWMRALAERLVRDESLADDLVQDTWLAALKSSSSGRLPDDPGRLRPWLAHVLTNFARARHRGDVRRAERESSAASGERLPSAADTAERIEAQRALVEALGELDEPYRTTVTLRYFDGLSSAEIARRLRVPAGTVRWRLQHAITELRARLDRRYGGDRGAWCVALFALARRPPLHPIGSGSLALAQGVLTMHMLGRIGIGAAALVLISLGVWTAREALDARAVVEPERDSPPSKLLADVTAASAPNGELSDVAAADARTQIVAAASIEGATREVTQGRLEGRIVDSAHQPLAGVTFELVSNLSQKVVKSELSGADGRLVLEIAFDDETWSSHYRVRGSGRATRFAHIDWAKHGATPLGDIVLDPGGAVRGIVLTPEGSPAENARVFVTEPELVYDVDALRRRGPETYPGVPESRSRPDGSFRIDGVPAKVVRVWAAAPDMRFSLTSTIDVREGEVRGGIELRLEPLAADDRIEGVVRDPEGRPVDGALVEYWYEGPRATGGKTIAAEHDGHFRIDLEQKVPYDLHVRDPKDRWPELHLPAVAPGVRDFELRFREPRTIVLAVHTPSGAGISRFAVQLKRPDEHRLGAAVEEDHAEGRASIRIPTQPFVVEVLAPGFSLGRLGPFEPEDVRGSLECTLNALPGVRGRVVAGGRPIAGARVELVRMCDVGERLEISGFVRRLKGVLETTTTDSNGQFQLTARARGRLAILCDADGFATSELSPIDNDPAVGAADLAIALTNGGTIEGRVLVPEGVEPTGTSIELSRGDSRPHELRVGADGAFRFDRLTPGRWVARRTAPGENRRSVAMSSNGEGEVEVPWNCILTEGATTHYDFDVRAIQPCVLVAHVSFDGKPATGWMIALWPDPHPKMSVAPPVSAIGEDGSGRIEAAGPGHCEIVLGAPEEWGSRVQFSDRLVLAAGQNVWQLDLATGSIEGHVGPKHHDKLLYFRWKGSGDQALSAQLSPDAQGEFRLRTIPAGKGSIDVYDRAANDGLNWSRAIEVDVPVDGVRRVDLP